ncbi:MAG: aldo/keto reductase [Gammaproteobacteria bacterium]|nr:aldo/keto reductase [Gammaproteobacteria bacterium]
MNRRQLIALLAMGVGALVSGTTRANARQAMLVKSIPSSGERIPAIGMGSSVTFNVGDDASARAQRAELLRAFFRLGGGMLDSSPMYGSSEAVIGDGLRRLGRPPGLFAATKVWTSSGEDGPAEIEASRGLWGVERFDLIQVHNLLAWEAHLETLFEMKRQGAVRYVGITTSHGRRHADLETIMRAWPIDFVQATYNIRDREVEQRILPLAAERGIAFIANRPFQRGGLIDAAKRHPLPAWAQDIDCADWAAFLLKFIVSHPAVTCAIPATTRIDHLTENMAAMHGRLPDPQTRQRMIDYVEGL